MADGAAGRELTVLLLDAGTQEENVSTSKSVTPAKIVRKKFPRLFFTL
jgi:hypothetical protein